MTVLKFPTWWDYLQVAPQPPWWWKFELNNPGWKLKICTTLIAISRYLEAKFDYYYFIMFYCVMVLRFYINSLTTWYILEKVPQRPRITVKFWPSPPVLYLSLYGSWEPHRPGKPLNGSFVTITKSLQHPNWYKGADARTWVSRTYVIWLGVRTARIYTFLGWEWHWPETYIYVIGSQRVNIQYCVY